MRKRDGECEKWRGPRRRFSAAHRAIRCTALPAFLLAASAGAQTPGNPSSPHAGAQLDTVTVEARRERAILERRVGTFVDGITTRPFQESLARWQKEIPICLLVGGLPRDDGEYLLARLSQIAAAAKAALAPENCKPNFYVIVTSVPDELIAAWSNHNPLMFGDAGGTEIHRFLKTAAPVRVWYNAELVNLDGTPCHLDLDVGAPSCQAGGHVRFGSVRDLSSVIVLVDARRVKGISFGQLAAYVAMVGLAEIRVDAKFGDAPTILRLFTDPANAPTLGMSAWDTAYLKALYQTQHEDRTQLLALRAAMLKDVAP